MGSRPPSRTTARATRPPKRLLSVTLSSVTLVLAISFFAGCSDGDVIPASARDKLEPGTTYSADLDGDGVAEQILIQANSASLSISDGKTTYRSRDRWQIVEAHLGDTDRDGLLEVVTLVDDEQGRHLGLFAYFGGEYRERLVTDEIAPRPVALQVIGSGSVGEGTVTAPGAATDPSGDMILLTLEPAAGQTGTQTVLCRWNGFGFTGIEPGS